MTVETKSAVATVPATPPVAVIVKAPLDPVIEIPDPCVIDRTPLFDTVTAPVAEVTLIPDPAAIEFTIFVNKEPSPTNRDALTEDVFICCDDRREA